MSPEVLDRARGALVGLAVGDALGAQVEFQTAESIRRSHPKGVREMKGGGQWGLAPGQVTDDTEMAIALADSLFTGEPALKLYREWRASRPVDCGNTIGRALNDGAPVMTSEANGALMRCAPIGVRFWCDPEGAARAADADARVTHGSDACVGINRSFAMSVARAIRVGRIDARPPQELLADVDGKSAGWVFIAWELAVRAAYEFELGATFENVVRHVVEMGGDADTNGAIAGALVGAMAGEQAIPFAWRDPVLRCRVRPVQYHPARLRTLATILAHEGESSMIPAVPRTG